MGSGKLPHIDLRVLNMSDKVDQTLLALQHFLYAIPFALFQVLLFVAFVVVSSAVVIGEC